MYIYMLRIILEKEFNTQPHTPSVPPPYKHPVLGVLLLYRRHINAQTKAINTMRKSMLWWRRRRHTHRNIYSTLNAPARAAKTKTHTHTSERLKVIYSPIYMYNGQYIVLYIDIYIYKGTVLLLFSAYIGPRHARTGNARNMKPPKSKNHPYPTLTIYIIRVQPI